MKKWKKEEKKKWKKRTVNIVRVSVEHRKVCWSRKAEVQGFRGLGVWGMRGFVGLSFWGLDI